MKLKTAKSNSKEKTSSSTKSWKTSQKSLSNASKKPTKIATQLLQSSPNACKEAAPTTQIPPNNQSQRKNQSSRSTTSTEPTPTATLVSPALKNTSIILRRNSAGFNAAIVSLNRAMGRSNASWTILSLSWMRSRRIPRRSASNASRRTKRRRENKIRSKTNKKRR